MQHKHRATTAVRAAKLRMVEHLLPRDTLVRNKTVIRFCREKVSWGPDCELRGSKTMLVRVIVACAMLVASADGFMPAAVGGLSARAGTPSLRSAACPARGRAVQLPARLSMTGSSDGDEVKEAGEVTAAKDEVPAVPKKGPKVLYGYGNEAPTWKMTMSLTGTPEEGSLLGSGAEVQVTCKMRFREDEGFEPPQGPIEVLDSRFIGSTQAFWKLDEDPTKEGFDKAGFWIWGLFEEPQYPFVTFNLEIKEEIKLAEGTIPVGQIYGQAKITRDKEKGISLSDGLLTLRQPVKLKVDLLGLSEGILQDIMACGTFTLTPE